MNDKQKELGWVEGNAADFLGLSQAEEQLIAIKIALSDALHEAREKAGLTQREFAERLGIKQPNVVRLESGSASLDLILHALLELGTPLRKIARCITEAQGEEASQGVQEAAVRKPGGRVTLKGSAKNGARGHAKNGSRQAVRSV